MLLWDERKKESSVRVIPLYAPDGERERKVATRDGGPIISSRVRREGNGSQRVFGNRRSVALAGLTLGSSRLTP